MEHTVVTVWGVEGHGKSLLVKSWMMACIRGATYNGKPARRGSVVYLAWEGRRKYTGERQEAWLRYYRYAVADVDGFKAQHFSDPLDEDRPLGEGDLFSPRGREQLAARIEADPSYGPPVMVVLDTGTSLVEGMKRKHSQQAWIEVAKLCRWTHQPAPHNGRRVAPCQQVRQGAVWRGWLPTRDSRHQDELRHQR